MNNNNNKILIDHSVALDWIFIPKNRKYSSFILKCLSEDKLVYVHELFIYETLNSLSKLENHKIITHKESKNLMSFLESLNFLTIKNRSHSQVLDVARKYNLNYCEALTLRSALNNGLHLATLNAGLRAIAQQEGIYFEESLIR